MNEQEIELTTLKISEISDRYEKVYALLENRVSELSDKIVSINVEYKKQLEEKAKLAKRLETLLELLPSGVIELDSNGEVIKSNEAADLLLDIKAKGKPWRDVISSSFLPQADDGHEISTAKGKKLKVATKSLDKYGQVVVLTDLTQTRLLQNKLSLNERLASVGKMMAKIAHQIRTPLSAALLYASHLEQAAIKEENRIKFSKKVKERLVYLNHLVDNMLVFVKSGTVITKEVMLHDFIETVKARVYEIVEGQDVKLVISNQCKNLKVNIDEQSLIGAIINLVENSIETEVDFLKIEVQFKITIDNSLEIKVSDNGPGINVDQLKQIKETFYTTKETGTGLGLAVVKQVANSLNGDIWLKNGVCDGLEVGILIPLGRQ